MPKVMVCASLIMYSSLCGRVGLTQAHANTFLSVNDLDMDISPSFHSNIEILLYKLDKGNRISQAPFAQSLHKLTHC